jgi:hypothetical protein
MIVGGFRRGAAIFNRQPLTVEASREAGFVTDETGLPSRPALRLCRARARRVRDPDRITP